VAVGVLALLLWWSERRRHAALARLGNPALIRRMTAGVNTQGRRWQRILWLAATALLMVALARPQWGEQVETIERQGLQLVVALDVSTSMLADDIKPSRLERARLEIAELMQRLQGDEVALVLFSGASFVQFPLTSDYATARKFLEGAEPGVISRPGTDVGGALRTALNAFEAESESQKVVVLITDGEAHDAETLRAAQELADADVRIFTIGFGSPEGAAVPQVDVFGRVVGTKIDAQGLPVISKLDEATLQEIANIGGGIYSRAEAGGQELAMLTDALAQMQRGDVGETSDVRRIERFQLFLALALAALLAATLIPDTLAPRRAASPASASGRAASATRRGS
jgi:Ca-activated chloride channel family protein